MQSRFPLLLGSIGTHVLYKEQQVCHVKKKHTFSFLVILICVHTFVIPMPVSSHTEVLAFYFIMLTF
jgi:hypothetical protein